MCVFTSNSFPIVRTTVCVAVKHHSEFCIPSWLCSASQRKQSLSMFSQLSSVLPHFNNLPVSWNHPYLFIASVQLSCLPATLCYLFPNDSPLGYEWLCVCEKVHLIFGLSSTMWFLLHPAALSAIVMGHRGLLYIVPCRVVREYEILILDLDHRGTGRCATWQKDHAGEENQAWTSWWNLQVVAELQDCFSLHSVSLS